MKIKKESFIFLLTGLLLLTISRVLYSILSFIDVLYWNDYLFSHKMAVIEYGSYILILISMFMHIKSKRN